MKPADIEGPLNALRGLGVSEAQLAEARAQLQAQVDAQAAALAKRQAQQPPAVATLNVLPENWCAWRVFEFMGEQWQWVPFDGRVVRARLLFELVPLVLASFKGEPWREPLAAVLPKLRVMEAAALQELRGSTY